MNRQARCALGDELRRAAAEVPDQPFIRTMGGEWTYRDVDAQTDRLALALDRLQVARGDPVTLMLPNGIEFITLWFALNKLGAVAAPVNTSLRGAALMHAVDLVQSRLIIVHTTLLAALRESAGERCGGWCVVVIGDDSPSVSGQAVEVLPHRALFGEHDAGTGRTAPQTVSVRASEPALMLYTSGTTGRSKAATISHRFVLTHARLVIQGLGLRADDVLYCPYPLFHLDAAVMTVVPALLLRGVAAIGERFSVSAFWDEVRAMRATVFDFMGATLTMLWKQPPSLRDREHRARLGWGVPLPDWALGFEDRFGCRLVELYGMTEVGAMIYTPLDEPRRLGSCGKPIGPFQVALLDEEGFEVPTGQVGELALRPLEPSVIMDGYYGMPEATLAAFRDLWFHTGDLLRRDVDGWFYFVGRRKDMVRRRGENISAAQVEAGIETHPDVLECAVFGVPSDMTEEDVMAVVVRRPGTRVSAQDLFDHGARHMARFMVPRYLRFVPALPRTPTDKVEKFHLKQEGITADTVDRGTAPWPVPRGHSV